MAYDSRKVGMYGAVGILIAIMIAGSIDVYFSSAAGTLTILVTDPPQWGDVTQVYINITKIELHRANEEEESGWILLSQEELELNLTSVLDTEAILLREAVQAGKYNQISFEISNATVTVFGNNETASVPSGKVKIKIIQGGVTVNPGESSTLLVDIETKVIYSQGKGYKLVPSVKAIPVSGS